MTLNLTFRAVGLYAFFPSISLDGLSEESTIEDILRALSGTFSTFEYGFGPTQAGKQIVTSISYDYSTASEQPPNVSGPPVAGPRIIKTSIGAVSQVWQYYRSAIVTIDGTDFEIRNRTVGQPSFADTTISQGFHLPTGATLKEYKLVFRNVTIDLSPEKEADYLTAKMAPTA